MSNPKIRFQDIQPGDTIRAEWTFQDIQLTRVGKAYGLKNSDWYTELGTQLTQEIREADYYLLDRPKPPLPTESGTIIIAEMPIETVALVRRDDNWWSLDGEGFYATKAVAQRPWKIAKVIEA